MRYMIMSGTSDSTKVIKFLHEDENNFILATTVTDYGAKIAENAGATEVISKALKEEDFIAVIKEKNIEVLIDATHPFASVATETAISSSQKAGIRYIRYERASTVLPESDLIVKVPTFEDAACKAKEYLVKDDDKIMHLAGVMRLASTTEKIDPQKVVTRVLPNNFSITKTLDTGVPAENIIAMQGTYSEELNMALMKEYNVKAIITKESGESGGAESKINAAINLDIPVILVSRPEIKQLENHTVVRDIEELKKVL